MTDSAVADHAASDRPSRRALLGAGVIGAALALSRSTSANATGLSEADTALCAFAIGVELAARDLYDAAIAAGADAEIWSVLREQHESYATRIAGIAGLPADARNEDVYAALASAFGSSNPAEAAADLENTAVATHTELLRALTDNDPMAAVASIAAMESRHAVILSGLAGVDDFDALFIDAATPLSPEA